LTNKNQAAEIHRKGYEIVGWKEKLQELKTAFEGKFNTQIPLEVALRREEAVKNEAELKNKNVERTQETKSMNLRRVNAELQSKLDTKDRELVQLSKEHKSLTEQCKEVTDHYTKLYDEAKRLVYSLERREHDLNYLKAKMNTKEADHTGTFSLVIGKLQTDLRESNAEVEKLRQLWLQSQKECLETKEKISQMDEENIVLKVDV
jgi:chromosome segregation ATPase